MRPPETHWITSSLVASLMLAVAGSLAAQDASVKVVVDTRQQPAPHHLRGAELIARRGHLLIYEAGPDTVVVPAVGLVPRPDFDSLQLRRGVQHTGGKRAQPHKGPSRRLQLVQFAAPPTDRDLQLLRSHGAQLVHYVPQNAFLVWTEDDRAATALSTTTPGDTPIQFQADYEFAHAVSPSLDRDLNGKAPLEVTIQLFNASDWAQRDVESIERRAHRLAPPRLVLGDRYLNLRATVPARAVPEIAALPTVVNIEPYREPRLYGETQAQIVAGNLTASGAAPIGPGYLGWLGALGFPTESSAYPIVAIVDDGIDNGTTLPATTEFYELNDPNRPSRIVFAVTPPGAMANSAQGPDGHGHLNASIVAGYNAGVGPSFEDHLGFNYGLGIAPYARIANVRVFTPTFDPGSGNTTMVADYHQRGARISSNSWGSDVAGSYDSMAQEYDALSRDARPDLSGNQEILLVFAAGNEGPLPRSIGSPATAKNVLSVGASENHAVLAGAGTGCGDSAADGDDARDLAGFSSRGPCEDGRIKPEIVAPGTFVHGAASQPVFTGASVCGASGNDFAPPGTDALFPPGSAYTWSSGTSVSTPAISAYAALVVEWLERNYQITDPSPALLKAYIVHSARYLTGSSAGGSLPSPSQGFGVADMGLGFRLASPRFLLDQDVLLDESGDGITFTGSVPDPNEPVRIVLAWSDAPGSTIGDAFVNDLNLSVNIGGTVYKGNHFTNGQSQAGGLPDFRNNVEAVFLPPGTSGPATITVEALSISGDGVPGNADPADQDFALVAYNFTDVTSTGVVSLDRSRYRCSDTVRVTVRDIDLRGSASAPVSLTTATGDSELVVAHEAPPDSGIFRAAVATSPAATTPHNGILETAHGDTITATYHDGNDGSGNPATVDDAALVDCTAPQIFGLEVQAVGGSYATLALRTDEPASVLVRYGSSCDDLSQSFAGKATATEHHVTITGLVPLMRYFFSVEATDAAGNVAVDNNQGECFTFSTLEPFDYFTQLFGATAFDLEQRTLTLVPDGSADVYTACVTPAASLPVDPVGGTVLSLPDDGSRRIFLASGAQVQLYGTAYSSLFVNSNGNLTFGVSDSDFSPSLSDHFRVPRVAALFDDLDPSKGGTVSWKQLQDRIVVTYLDIPQYAATDSNTFQIELFFDGTIRITYLGIASGDALVGVSAGAGVPIDFVQSDLGGYLPCSTSMGRLLLDAPIYTCADTIAVTVEDADLAGVGQVTVQVAGSGGDLEVLSLAEMAAGSAIFSAILPTATGDIAPNNGVLEITSSQVVSATYFDADSGGGTPLERVMTARTLCTDHFMLYKTKVSGEGSAFYRLGPLMLGDDFRAAAYNLILPVLLGLPANKNAEGVMDPVTHLQGYKVKAVRGTPRFEKVSEVRVISQCGDLHVEVMRPVTLLVAAHMDPVAPVPAPDPNDHRLDHFLCYQAKALRTLADGTRVPGIAKGTQVEVVDGFQSRLYDLERVSKLCVPVDQLGTPVYLAGPDKGAPKPVAPSPIRNPHDRLICYHAVPAKEIIPQSRCGAIEGNGIEMDPPQAKHTKREGLHVHDPLGPGRRDTVREVEFCIPSLHLP